MGEHELLLLGLLDRQSMHGYRLHEFLEHSLHFISDLKKATAYRLLEQLRAQGLVEGEAEREGRRPERIVYRLTEAGQARIAEMVREQLARADWVLYPGNVALLFMDRLTPGERATLLASRRQAVAALRTQLVPLVEAHSMDTTARLVLEHDLAHLDTELAWLDKLLASLPLDQSE